MNMFIVWAKMKDKATANAARGYRVSAAEARAIVLELCREERAQRPPPEALEYLAGELIRLTAEAREPHSRDPWTDFAAPAGGPGSRR
jgi:hypothetical protein